MKDTLENMASSVERRHFMQALALAAGTGLAASLSPLHAAGKGHDKGKHHDKKGLTAVEPFARVDHATCLLPGGRILVVGGTGVGGALASCQIYDVNDDTWYDAAPLSRARGAHTATPISGNNVLVLGGYNHGALAMASLYDPIKDTWQPAAPLRQPRYRHNAQTLPDGRVVLTGGYHLGMLSQPEIYQL
ncbi:MAG: twin-arginine translocation signal domain-containing protein [Verrucomicrobiaceae bacterium]|nr:twin-arginine translocation signal domain-containing protein [Verrucomicrobiaceae bacterium]